MTLPRLDPQPRVGDQVFEVIHRAIMNGEYPAGHRLRIRTIAQETGTSPMPVREAIRRLEELGLVESTPNRGARVRDFTHEDLLDVYAVRRILEDEAARLGVAAIGPTGIARMREELALLDDAIARRDLVAYLDADESLLAVLYAAAGNPVLVETIQNLWQRCRSYKLVGVRTGLETGETDVLRAYQRDLIAAAEAADPDRAAHLTAGSLDSAMSRIRTTLRT